MYHKRIRNISKRRVVATIIIIVLSAYVLFIRDSTSRLEGYCLKEKRFLTDEDFIQLAVRRALKDPPQLRPDIDGSELSIMSFSQEHPGCCRVTHEIKKSFFGNYLRTSVVLEIKTKEKDSSRRSPSEYTTWTVMRECGELVFHSGGG